MRKTMDLVQPSALLTLLLILSSVLLAGCSKDIHDHPDLVTGKQLFEYHCSGCHKSTGTGIFLKGVPANKNTDLTRGQITHKLRKGDDLNTKMPIFPNMGIIEAAKIATYVDDLE